MFPSNTLSHDVIKRHIVIFVIIFVVVVVVVGDRGEGGKELAQQLHKRSDYDSKEDSNQRRWYWTTETWEASNIEGMQGQYCM